MLAYKAMDANSFIWLKITSRPYEPHPYEISGEAIAESERMTMALAMQLQQQVDRVAANTEVVELVS